MFILLVGGGEDFHDKEEERTKMRRHEDMEATIKRTRSMEELPSPYQQNKQSTCFVLSCSLSWKSFPNLLNIVSRRWVAALVLAVARVEERMVVRLLRPSQEGSTNLTINLTAAMPTHLLDAIFNKLGGGLS